jgi:hypothetical protein
MVASADVVTLSGPKAWKLERKDIVLTVLIPHLSRTEAGLQDEVAPHGFTMTRRSDGQ